jgi:hypothetical protein
MQEGHTLLEFLRQGNGIVQRLLGICAKVEGNENMMDGHGDVLSRCGLLESSGTISPPILIPRRPQQCKAWSRASTDEL